MDYNNNIPIYSQLAKEIKIQMYAGILKPGDRLLSVRDLAVEYRVNPNTVQKAYVELENEGLIYTERTNGRFVTMDKRLIERCKREYAKKLTREYKRKMKEIGL